MKRILLTLGLLTFMTASLFGDELEPGAAAPDINVTDDNGVEFNLAAALGEGYTLVYFYPKADTPGCTSQACSLRDSWDVLSERGVTVYGVSSDSVKSQASFKDKYALPFPLIADTDRKVADAFGKGRWSRQAYLFKDGVLVWRDLKASTSAQAEDVLAALDQIEATR